jgi:hypothetical protein
VVLLALPQLLSTGTGIEIAAMVVGEVGPLEGAVLALGLSKTGMCGSIPRS